MMREKQEHATVAVSNLGDNICSGGGGGGVVAAAAAVQLLIIITMHFVCCDAHSCPVAIE